MWQRQVRFKQNICGGCALPAHNRFCPAAIWKFRTSPSPPGFAIKATSPMYSAGSRAGRRGASAC